MADGGMELSFLQQLELIMLDQYLWMLIKYVYSQIF